MLQIETIFNGRASLGYIGMGQLNKQWQPNKRFGKPLCIRQFGRCAALRKKWALVQRQVVEDGLHPSML